MVTVPIRTSSGLNARESWRNRARRVKGEREAASWVLRGAEKPPVPLRVHLTRVAPSSGLDDDNLAGALKAIRDAFADWIGVDDRHAHIVSYSYAQKRGPWGVTIDWAPGGQE